MRRSVLIVIFYCSVGCIQVPPLPSPPPTTMTSWSPMGGFSVSSGSNCAGQATLTGGSATIQDACFTGVDNVVLCTDTTTVSAVRCTPANGTLAIAGSSNDVVAYARIR